MKAIKNIKDKKTNTKDKITITKIYSNEKNFEKCIINIIKTLNSQI